MAGKRLALLRTLVAFAVVTFLALLGLTFLFGPDSLLRANATEADRLEACAVGAIVLTLLFALARTRIRPPRPPS